MQYRGLSTEKKAESSMSWSVGIRQRMARMLDESTTRVCFSVTSYEKCVTYGAAGPNELEGIATRIFSEANKRVNARMP